MDGRKVIRKTAEQVFGAYALIERRQWHTGENVVEYLPKGRKAPFRTLLQRACEQPTYEGAKGVLRRATRERSFLNESAVRSLEERREKTPSIDWASLRSCAGALIPATASSPSWPSSGREPMR
jgi:hypothetical protein